MDLFKNYNYPENFINNCFKKFLHNKDTILDEMIPVHKKTLFWSFVTLDHYYYKLEPN